MLTLQLKEKVRNKLRRARNTSFMLTDYGVRFSR